MAKSPIKGRAKGAGSVWKSRGKYVLTIRIDGKSKSVVLRNPDGTPCTTRQQADAAAGMAQAALSIESREQLAAFTAETRRLKAAVMPLAMAGLWDAFVKSTTRPDSGPVTLNGYKGAINRLVTWSNSRGLANVADITPDMADEFMADEFSDVGPRRYNAVVQSCRLVFEHVGKRICSDNPFTGIRLKRLETLSRKAFTAEQVQAIFAGFDRGFFYETEVEGLGAGRERERKITQLAWKPMFANELRIMLYLACFTGCRGQDAALMEWNAVNFANNTISYCPRKTSRTSRKSVTLPLHSDLRKALLNAMEWRAPSGKGDDYILPNLAERFKRNPRGVQADVQKAIRCATGLETTVAAKTAGKRKLAASEYSLHSFRHTFVSFCSNAGVPLSLVAEVVGHSSPAMTEHYAHTSIEAQNKAIASLPSMTPVDGVDDEKATLLARIAALTAGATIEQLRTILSVLEK